MQTQLVKQAEEKFKSSLDHLETELVSIRSGRASSGLVDGIKAEVYGQKMTLKSISTITTPDAKTIQIQPWDISNLPFIEKAISENQSLGLNPSSDGRVVRISIPPLSEEVRTQITKLVKEKAEQANISLRNIRHEILNSAKSSEKAKDLTKDDVVKIQKDLDNLVDQYHKKIQEIVNNKIEDLMSV